jgi:hypothetical protein
MSAKPDSLPQDPRDGSVAYLDPIIESPSTPGSHATASKLHTGIRNSKRPQTSMIWMHHRQSSGDSPLIDKDGDIIWSCLYCQKTYKYKSGTRKAIEHLQRSHSINGSNTGQTQEQDKIQSPSREANCSSNISTLKELYLKWITSHSAALKQAQSPEFRAFLEYISPYANTLLSLDILEMTTSTLGGEEQGGEVTQTGG